MLPLKAGTRLGGARNPTLSLPIYLGMFLVWVLGALPALLEEISCGARGLLMLLDLVVLLPMLEVCRVVLQHALCPARVHAGFHSSLKRDWIYRCLVGRLDTSGLEAVDALLVGRSGNGASGVGICSQLVGQA